MKRVLTALIFVISLVLIVSCPDQHPIIKMTEPVGENAERTAQVGNDLVFSNVVLELLNDSFDETTVKNNADVSIWFVPSDKNKLEVKSATITDVVADDSNTKSDSDIGKTTKVTVNLTVTPKKPTGNKSVNVAVVVPKSYSSVEERWTMSNKKISVLATDIKVTIPGEEEKEDDPVDIILTPSTIELFEFKQGSVISQDTTIDFTLKGATWKTSVDKNAFTPALPAGVDIATSIDETNTKLTLTFLGTPTADPTSDAISYAFDAKSLISFDKKTNKIPNNGLKGTVRIKITDKDVKPYVQFAYGKANGTVQDKTFFTFYNPKEIEKDNVFTVTLTGGTWTDGILTADYINASSAIMPNLKLPNGINETRTLNDDKTTLTITFSGTPTVISKDKICRIPVTNLITPSPDYDVPQNKYIAFSIEVDKAVYVTYAYTSNTYLIDSTTNTITVVKGLTGTRKLDSLIFTLENATWDHDAMPNRETPVPTNTDVIPSDYITCVITHYDNYQRKYADIDFIINYDNINNYDIFNNPIVIDLTQL